MTEKLNRRQMLQTGSAFGAAWLTGNAALADDKDKPAAVNNRIHQSIVYWCFQEHWSLEETCKVARKLGCPSIELVDPKHWKTLKKYGLVCAIAGSHWFDKGMNNPKYHEMCIAKMRQAIDNCAEAGFPNVITFTGFRENISDDDGIKNCVAGYKKIVGYAEKKKVNLCLEMLNSRVAEKMKGHPGYQGDHTDYCMEIIKKVGSPRLKLLFDIYHVQIMDGDIITRIRQYADYIGHVHTAGNPGRRELDDKQEINYPPIMRALVEVGYKGYVGQEFIPTGDPYQGLRQAVKLCDV
ncbi:MAG: hydroxypyruvate isomerase [Gemmatales bacterium]|nr:MAG: hydroxypyruvate isomerase [Gemmatales bacterium]